MMVTGALEILKSMQVRENYILSYPTFSRGHLNLISLCDLVRTVQDGGESYYIRGDHWEIVPNLYHLIMKRLTEE